MTRRALVAVLAGLVILLGATASDCSGPPRVCEPGEVRQDSNEPGRYWQCNQDGTNEAPLDAPGDHEDPDPIEA
jgi:hypothetical protein